MRELESELITIEQGKLQTIRQAEQEGEGVDNAAWSRSLIRCSTFPISRSNKTARCSATTDTKCADRTSQQRTFSHSVPNVRSQSVTIQPRH